MHYHAVDLVLMLAGGDGVAADVEVGGDAHHAVVFAAVAVETLEGHHQDLGWALDVEFAEGFGGVAVLAVEVVVFGEVLGREEGVEETVSEFEFWVLVPFLPDFLR